MAELVDGLTVTFEDASMALARLAGFAGLEGSGDAQVIADYLAQTRPPRGLRVGDEAACEVALAGIDHLLQAGADLRQADLEQLHERIEAVRRGDEEG